MALLDFFVLFLIYILFYFKKWKQQGNDVLLIRTIMYVYLSFVLYFTLMPIISELPYIFSHPYRPMHLIPFNDIIKGHGDCVRQVILNVVMTIPFGILYPITQSEKKFKFLRTVIATFLLSLSIELIQPLISGFHTSDITDLFTNTTGGIIGYLFYILFKSAISKLFFHFNSKKIINDKTPFKSSYK